MAVQKLESLEDDDVLHYLLQLVQVRCIYIFDFWLLRIFTLPYTFPCQQATLFLRPSVLDQSSGSDQTNPKLIFYFHLLSVSLFWYYHYVVPYSLHLVSTMICYVVNA